MRCLRSPAAPLDDMAAPNEVSAMLLGGSASLDNTTSADCDFDLIVASP